MTTDPELPPAGVPAVLEFTSLRAALDHALEHTPHLIRDRATIALARRYADLLDDAADRLGEAATEDEARDFSRMATLVTKIGPRLEAVLNSLGMAPGARAATRAGDPQGAPGDRDPAAAALAQLQQSAAASAAGVDHTAHVDPAVEEADAGD